MLHDFDAAQLYYLGADNRIREWEISVQGTTIVISHGHLNGVKTKTYEEIEAGKGGRSVYGQIQSRVRSRINTQKLKGYKETVQEAQQGRTNALDLPKPMLAQPWNKIKEINFQDMLIQFKYDGNRCLITRQGKEVIAYSRKGKIIDSIPHILKHIDIPEGIVLDGELYHHGTPINILRSWISKKQPNSEKLCFHAYDVILPIQYNYRLNYLRELGLTGPAHVVPTFVWDDIDEPSLNNYMTLSRRNNYEGIILRANTTGYDVGKRSKQLIKVKQFLDSEFIVVDIYKSEKGMPMATCRINDNKTFDVVLPGTHETKTSMLHEKDKYIGKTLTVEFSQWTTDGKPFHAVAKAWREI